MTTRLRLVLWAALAVLLALLVLTAWLVALASGWPFWAALLTAALPLLAVYVLLIGGE